MKSCQDNHASILFKKADVPKAISQESKASAFKQFDAIDASTIFECELGLGTSSQWEWGQSRQQSLPSSGKGPVPIADSSVPKPQELLDYPKLRKALKPVRDAVTAACKARKSTLREFNVLSEKLEKARLFAVQNLRDIKDAFGPGQQDCGL